MLLTKDLPLPQDLIKYLIFFYLETHFVPLDNRLDRGNRPLCTSTKVHQGFWKKKIKVLTYFSDADLLLFIILDKINFYLSSSSSPWRLSGLCRESPEKKIDKFYYYCLVLLQVPKRFGPVQIFWASPKIGLHLVPLQKCK